MAQAGGKDCLLEAGRGAVRAATGPARAVAEPRGSLLAIAPQPLVDGCARAAELMGDLCRTVSAEDALDEQRPSVDGQTGVSVSHEDPLGLGRLQHLHRASGVLPASTRD